MKILRVLKKKNFRKSKLKQKKEMWQELLRNEGKELKNKIQEIIVMTETDQEKIMTIIKIGLEDQTAEILEDIEEVDLVPEIHVTMIDSIHKEEANPVKEEVQETEGQEVKID